MASLLNIINFVVPTLKAAVSDNSDLRSIVKIYKGAAVNPSDFPLVAIIPVEENFIGMYGSQLRMRKKIRVEITQYKLDQKESIKSSLELSQKIRNYFKLGELLDSLNDDGTLLNYASGITSVNISSNPLPFRTGFLHTSTFEVEYYTQEYPFNKISGFGFKGTLDDTDTESLVEYIEQVYRAALNDLTFISGVKDLKSFSLGVAPDYPLAFITVEDEIEDRFFAGKSLESRTIAANFITNKLDYEQSLVDNLAGIEKLKHVMFANTSWEGRAINTELSNVIYGQVVLEGRLLYGSSLRFIVQGYGKI